MKKIIVTGSNGLLGQSLLNLLLKQKNKYHVIGFSRGKNRSGRIDFEYVFIDITDKELLSQKLLDIQPDVIIHTAAMTDVDACEVDKENCDKLNTNVVKSLAVFCKKNRVHLIHISTDFIFDGKTGYYKETSAPKPLNNYGISKLKAEKIIVGVVKNYTILRTVLMYGYSNNHHKDNIVLKIKKSLEEGKKINIVNDQFRMPTYVENLAMACKIVMDRQVYGIFNISSNELLSMYQIAQQIAMTFGLDETLINPITSKTLNQKAARPFKTGFDLEKTNKKLGIFPKSFKEDLQKFKKNLHQNMNIQT